MPPRLLYQRLCLQLRACAPQFGVWHRQRLALLVTGLLLARHTALPRLAAQLRRVTPTAHADSIERRLRRALADPTFKASVFEQVVRISLRSLPAGRCLLLLDDTQQTTHCTLSTLALAYAGRALPLAWCRWSGKLHGGYWKQIDQLFDQAARLLPPQVQPVVVADRGIASPMLVRLVQQRGWDYLLRVTNDTTVQQAGQSPKDALHLGELFDRPSGVVVRLTGKVFRRRSVSSHAVAVWEPGHKEPWLLVSNLDLGRELVGLYARRMQVEALFRDTKSGGLEWELSRVLDAERAERLLLGIMLAIWCAVLLGEAAVRAGEIPAYGRRAHAVSLVRRGLDWLSAPPRSRYFHWTLDPPKPVRI
jgi:Transposase DDE domain